MRQVGNMDRKIELKSMALTKSDMGGPVKTYTHWKYKMASRVAAGELPESYVNNRLIVAPRWKYQMHTDAGITETMKLIDDSIEYNILLIAPVDKLFLEILVEKIVE